MHVDKINTMNLQRTSWLRPPPHEQVSTIELTTESSATNYKKLRLYVLYEMFQVTSILQHTKIAYTVGVADKK